MIIVFAIISHLLYIIWGNCGRKPSKDCPCKVTAAKLTKKKKNEFTLKSFRA